MRLPGAGRAFDQTQTVLERPCQSLLLRRIKRCPRSNRPEPLLHPGLRCRIALLGPGSGQKVRQRVETICGEDRPHGVVEPGTVPVGQILLQRIPEPRVQRESPLARTQVQPACVSVIFG